MDTKTIEPSIGTRSRVRRLRCLVLVDFYALPIGTVARHIGALREFSAHDIQVAYVRLLNSFEFDISHFDVIVFHYSIVIAKGFHIGAKLRASLADSTSLKVLFIQDEYRWIDDTAEAMRELGIDVLFTVVNSDVVDRIYHHPWLRHVRKELTLTGFVDETLLDIEVPPYEERGIDVVYRARKVPYWLGAFAMDKWTIGKRFEQEAVGYDLTCDISSDESARLYGADWIRFISNAKAVLGTESGASVCDFSGSLRICVDEAVNLNKDIDFETIQNNFLKEADGQIVIHVVSPRIFEAAALRTLMVNYPGEYSRCLVPWRHYVPLEKDHSNIAEVVAVIRNPEQARKIIDAAYREVACNPGYSFRAFVKHFDKVVAEEIRFDLPNTSQSIFSIRNWHWLEAVSWIYFYSSSALIKARVLAISACGAAWRIVRIFLPPTLRERIKESLRQRGKADK